MIPQEALVGHAVAMMQEVGLRRYRARVGRVAEGRWAECRYSLRELVFSPELLRSDLVFVNQIILHEVAHGLVGGGGHSRAWLKTARAIGYELSAQVPYDYPMARGFRWVVMCENLLHSSLRKEQEYADGARDCALCFEAGAGRVPMLWEAL